MEEKKGKSKSWREPQKEDISDTSSAAGPGMTK